MLQDRTCFHRLEQRLEPVLQVIVPAHSSWKVALGDPKTPQRPERPAFGVTKAAPGYRADEHKNGPSAGGLRGHRAGAVLVSAGSAFGPAMPKLEAGFSPASVWNPTRLCRFCLRPMFRHRQQIESADQQPPHSLVAGDNEAATASRSFIDPPKMHVCGVRLKPVPACRASQSGGIR